MLKPLCFKEIGCTKLFDLNHLLFSAGKKIREKKNNKSNSHIHFKSQYITKSCTVCVSTIVICIDFTAIVYELMYKRKFAIENKEEIRKKIKTIGISVKRQS